MRIESNQNPKIKRLLQLQSKKKARLQEGLFVVEGVQENQLALQNGYVPESFFVLENVFSDAISLDKNLVFEVSEKVFEKIAYRGTTGGIVGIYQMKSQPISDLELSKNPCVLILEGIEKPGNLGAILRTAHASGIVDAVVLCDAPIDLYNPNVIRSSVGSVFSNHVCFCSFDEINQWLSQNKINSYATFLNDDTKDIYRFNFSEPTAFVMGEESKGLSSRWKNKANHSIKIPMQQEIDSLNLSNATAICLYEAVRQRLVE